MRNSTSLILIILGGLLLLTAVLLAFLHDATPQTKELTKCYDLHNHEIIGAECIDYKDTLGQNLILGLAIMALGLLFAGILLGMD